MTIQGMDALLKKLRKLPEEVAKVTETAVKMTAVQVCVEYARATGPGVNTLSDKPVTDYGRAVKRQIESVFPSSERPAAVAALVKRRSEKLYRAYLRAMREASSAPTKKQVRSGKLAAPMGKTREGKLAQARKYLAAAGIRVDELTRAAHDSARVGPGRSIPKKAEPVAVVNAARLRVYTREEVRRAGMAKAAWYQAAGMVVKRVRGTARGQDGRRSYQRFPQSLRKVAQRYPGLGYAEVMGSGMATVVKIASRVKHAPEASDELLMAQGRAIGHEGMARALAESVRAMNRRLFG
jgi:hypothetical protein